MRVEIDKESGFCFGVVTAIKKAEEALSNGEKIYCLGDIVHHNMEVERLQRKGLVTINHDEYSRLRNVRVMFRAHGEPPQTYRLAEQNNIALLDATCPVVLQLQKKIRLAYQSMDKLKDQILIFGKKGHAEVNGLVGQTEGTAIVVESPEDLDKVDMNKNILLFSQTTKSIEHFREIIELISQKKSENVTFNFFDTICRQVANRIPNIRKFATQFDLVLFVTGRKSSNGKVLYEECRQVNPNTQLVYSTKDIQKSWFEHVESVGICGATSTPIWLMEKVEEFVNKEYNTKTN